MVVPPSSGSVAPVAKGASKARKRIAVDDLLRLREALQRHPLDRRGPVATGSGNQSSSASIIGVSIGPGQTTLTRTVGASSAARRLGQADDPELRGAVGRVHPHADARELGADVDDRSAAGVEHSQPGLASDVEGS